MDRILVASSNDKATAMLVSLLKETFPTCKTSIAATGLETRRAVGSGSYDCVVINCPLSDEYGNELAPQLTQAVWLSQSRKMRISLLINWKISA